MKQYSDGRVYGVTPGERLLAHVRKSENDCWLWTGSVDQSGYGKFVIGGRYLGAHRVSYEAFVGPIPDGMTVDHMCFTPVCINPDHLRLLTHLENSTLQRSAIASHCQRGHEFTADNTWGGRAGRRRTCKTCQRARIAARREAAA